MTPHKAVPLLSVPSAQPLLLPPCPGQPQEHRCEGQLRMPMGNRPRTAPARHCLEFLRFLPQEQHVALGARHLKGHKNKPCRELRSNAFKQLLLFFDKLRLSKVAGHLRENGTNLCKSQQCNCHSHFHLKSIFKVVMETNMD